jgi:hypothetical protein
MKNSILFAAAAAVFAFVGQAEASVPDAGESLDTCLSWANSLEGSSAFSAATNRCTALNDCMTNQSDNYEELRECNYKAEHDFLVATGGALPSEGPAQASGVTTGVSTQVADSYYEQKGGDAKGFMEADVGK